MTDNIRFLVVGTLLASAAIFLSARSRSEIVPARESFASFPSRVGTWIGSDISIAPDVLQTLGPGDFLNRAYRDTSVPGSSVDLFVAYFPSQRAGDTLHSPRHCLPGSGWLPVQSSEIKIDVPGHEPFLANRYLIAKGGQSGLVLYWYWAHGRAVANEYWAKFYLVGDAIRLNRSDGSLIRLTTELKPHESAAEAQQRLFSLLKVAFPVMDAYIPRS